LILKEAGVQKIVLALDNDWDEDGDKFYGLHKMVLEGFKIQEMGFEVELMYDWEGELLGNKDSPIDRGRQIYSKLYRDRKNINEFSKEEWENMNNKEDTGEIQITNQEL
jgi:hypothetical protein